MSLQMTRICKNYHFLLWTIDQLPWNTLTLDLLDKVFFHNSKPSVTKCEKDKHMTWKDYPLVSLQKGDLVVVRVSQASLLELSFSTGFVPATYLILNSINMHESSTYLYIIYKDDFLAENLKMISLMVFDIFLSSVWILAFY